MSEKVRRAAANFAPVTLNPSFPLLRSTVSIWLMVPTTNSFLLFLYDTVRPRLPHEKVTSVSAHFLGHFSPSFSIFHGQLTDLCFRSAGHSMSSKVFGLGRDASHEKEKRVKVSGREGFVTAHGHLRGRGRGRGRDEKT